jgi:hypothetical protein
VKVIQLDERSRRQQVGEGHFGSLAEVPTHVLDRAPDLNAAELARPAGGDSSRSSPTRYLAAQCDR